MSGFDFHPEARAEYLSAIEYYNDSSAGLGEAFASEIEDAIDLIVKHPSAWTAMSAQVRRCMLGRFPYGIIYVAHEARVLILAVAHAKKKPGYWLHRRT